MIQRATLFLIVNVKENSRYISAYWKVYKHICAFLGTGAALIRLLYVKYPLIIQGKELQSVVVVMAMCIVLTSSIAYPFYILPVRQQRPDDICLGRSREFNLVLYDYVSPNQEPREMQLLVLILVVNTIIELVIYISICKYLYQLSA